MSTDDYVTPPQKNDNPIPVMAIGLGCLLLVGVILFLVFVANKYYKEYKLNQDRLRWETFRRNNPIYTSTTVSNQNAVFPE